MPTYNLVDGGNVTRGQMRFTSFSENVQAGELGQLIRFPAYTFEDSQLFCVRKVVLDYVGLGVIEDFPLVPTKDMVIWSPTTFVPSSFYHSGGATLLYFPMRTPVPDGAEWQVYRVFA